MSTHRPERSGMIAFAVALLMVAVRLGAWLVAAAIFVLSVVPPRDRPVVGPHVMEHATAFVVVGVAFALAYRRHERVGAGLIMFCIVVECAQLLAPGRHARLSDLFVNIAASLLGVVAVAFVEQMMRRYTKWLGERRDTTSS